MQDLGISILFQGNNLTRLLLGLWITIRISLISVACSILFGVILGVVMTRKNRTVRIITKGYLEFVRIMPQLVLLFIVYFGVTKAFRIHLSAEFSAVFVFSFWGTAEMGDLVRGAMESIPKQQKESGRALGLTEWQIYRYVIIPQTIRRLLPLAINLVTRMIKTTSLIALIGVVEVVKVGQQMIESCRITTPTAALWIYGVIFFLYFFICYPLSVCSNKLEKVWKN